MPEPRVGVGLFVFRPNGTFIIGKRKGALGSGSLGLPGGHLEFGESFTICAARELLEETGIKVTEESIHFLTAGNNVFVKEERHYVTIAMGVLLEGEMVEVEPEVRTLLLLFPTTFSFLPLFRSSRA
ncbi:NUDIX hydrolase [Venturia nashicola]|nr:NUDIX hydrolase [Venturia nashicola]